MPKNKTHLRIGNDFWLPADVATQAISLIGLRGSGKTNSAGLIVGENTGTMQITDAGMGCGPFDELPTGRDLVHYWLNHPSLGKCERAILAELIRHSAGLTAPELCEATGYEFSGGFRNALSALRTAGLIEGKNTGALKAVESLLSG